MARWAKGLGLLVGVGAAGAAVVGACLPSLAPNLCGNGHIDYGESCDPGVSSNKAGCDSFCHIVCTNPMRDGGPAYLDYPSTHCYYTSDSVQTFDDGSYACGLQNAHLVTFVDDDEVTDVLKQLIKVWPNGARFWVGLYQQDENGPYWSVSANEPGWNAVRANCFGCFLHGVAGPPPSGDAGADAGPLESILAVKQLSDNATMEAIGRQAGAQVVCEREPVGSRSTPCLDGMFCFNVLATISPDGGRSKRYLFNPNAAKAEDAETYCRQDQRCRHRVARRLRKPPRTRAGHLRAEPESDCCRGAGTGSRGLRSG